MSLTYVQREEAGRLAREPEHHAAPAQTAALQPTPRPRPSYAHSPENAEGPHP
ncbi:hypothetical protein ABT121_03470 [Streptomyces sp. NPDC001928]|uniref:hypothetical protein n=1 Tax=Streptomyces sp. NPDC001928 TaxID=3154404 RepID=UPI0033312AA9